MSLNDNNTKNYLDYTCPKCRTKYGIEPFATGKTCRTTRKINDKITVCGEPFPNQEVRNLMEKLQKHPQSTESE